MAGKYVFQSDHFANDDRIQACADVPLQHIKIGDQGSHVAKIQDALRQIREAGLAGSPIDIPPPIAKSPDIDEQKFAKSTLDAVQTYKDDRTIVNFAYQKNPDAVVGQMTIRQLDEDMAFVEGKRKEDEKPTQDFYIEIQGDAFLTGRDISDTEGLPFAKLLSTSPVYQKKHGQLIAIVFKGGFGPTDPFNAIMSRFDRESVGVKKFGRVVIQGISVGGRTAIRVAHQLTLKGISLDYVALNDAAFDEHDPLLKPSLSIDPSALKESYFQTWSFTIDPSKEFHGCPDGFISLDKTKNVETIQNQFNSEPSIFQRSESNRSTFADSAHSVSVQTSNQFILEKIRATFQP